MRVVDTKFNTLDRSRIDLEKGYLTPGRALKKGVTPIDNITKFAWEDSDFEEVEIYKLKRVDNDSPQESINKQIVELDQRVGVLEQELLLNERR